LKKILLDFFNHWPEADDRAAEGAVAGTGNKRGGGRQSAFVALLQFCLINTI
jgi:hypothetical protein